MKFNIRSGAVGAGAALVALTIVAASIGCGSGGPTPDEKVEAARVKKAQSMRSYFNKANGDYDKLSASDKADFVKECGGDEEKAKKAWDLMKYGPGGAPSSGGVPGGSATGSSAFNPNLNGNANGGQ